MTLISVLIVLAVEFYFRKGAGLRKFDWFDRLQQKLSEMLGGNAIYEGWGGILILLMLPVVILFVFLSAFEGDVYLLVLFVTSCIVLFLSLGPKPLEKSFAQYFEAMERGDAESAYLSLQKESLFDEIPQGEDLVRNATRIILVESQSRYFGVIFWFVFLGPYGALFYRLAHVYQELALKHGNEEHAEKMAKLIHIIDWAPARLTSILFLLTGDFVNGFYRVKDYFVDFSSDNRQLISETGMAALGLDMHSVDGDIKENHDAMQIVQRTLIVYLVVVAALSPVSFW